jgi:hypothetical protein
MLMPPTPQRLPEDLSGEVVVTGEKKFTVTPVTSAGIAFTPGPRNVGGYPLIVTVNGDEKRRHVVRGPQFLTGLLEGAELLVDASLGGGVAGDLWTVTILPDSAAGEQPRPLADTMGALLVREAGAKVLFAFDSQENTDAIADSFEDGGVGSYYVPPSSPGVLRRLDASGNVFGQLEAWDVSRYAHVFFAFAQFDPTYMSLTYGRNWALRPFCEMTYVRDGGVTIEKIQMGTGNFGVAGDDPYDGNNGLVGYITLGDAVAETGIYHQRSTRKLTHVRFGLFVWQNDMTTEMLRYDLVEDGYRLQIIATAW